MSLSPKPLPPLNRFDSKRSVSVEPTSSRRLVHVLALIVGVSSVAIGSAADWTLWRGPTGDNKAASDATPPIRWSQSRNIRWQTSLPGEGHASPIVVGDQVIASLCNRQKQIFGLASVNRRTGKVEWSQVAHTGGVPARIHPKNTHASQTPASDGEHIFVNYYSGNAILLFCYDMSGKKVWETNAGSYVPTKYQFGYGSSPTLTDDLVIVAGENDGPRGSWIKAFRKSNGREAWSVRRKSTLSFGSPVIGSPGGREQLLIAGGNTIAGFDPKSGRELWSVGGFATAVCGTPVWEGDLVFSSGGYPEQITMAVDATTGKEIWRDNVCCYEQSLLVHDGLLYGVSEKGVLYCWDAKTGEVQYRERQGGDQSASPILAAGHIYTLNERGETWVFKPGRSYEEVAKNDLGSSTFATPVPVDDELFYRDGNENGTSTLYCLGE